MNQVAANSHCEINDVSIPFLYEATIRWGGAEPVTHIVRSSYLLRVNVIEDDGNGFVGELHFCTRDGGLSDMQPLYFHKGRFWKNVDPSSRSLGQTALAQFRNGDALDLHTVRRAVTASIHPYRQHFLKSNLHCYPTLSALMASGVDGTLQSHTQDTAVAALSNLNLAIIKSADDSFMVEECSVPMLRVSVCEYPFGGPPEVDINVEFGDVSEVDNVTCFVINDKAAACSAASNMAVQAGLSPSDYTTICLPLVTPQGDAVLSNLFPGHSASPTRSTVLENSPSGSMGCSK